MAENTFEFAVGDHVVYPAHGVGRVQGIETQTIAGVELSLYSIIFEQDRMTLKVPTARATISGLRRLSSKDQMKNVISILKGKPSVKKVIWSHRAQEYETKINSGSLVSIAEVVRDLHPKDEASEQSYSERQMYQQAFLRLKREVAVIDSTGADQAEDKLITALKQCA